jgi:hypothetical protein
MERINNIEQNRKEELSRKQEEKARKERCEEEERVRLTNDIL